MKHHLYTPQKKKVVESPKLGDMEFKHYDPVQRRIFFFKTKEKYTAFIKRNRLKYVNL